MSLKITQLLNDLGNDTKTDETQRRIDDKDNTLMKYFIEEKNKSSNFLEKSNIIPLEKIESFLKKPIKLRNTLKKCYWDRQKIVIL